MRVNPIKVEACKAMDVAAKRDVLKRYKWSSYPGYVDKAAREDMVDYRWLNLMQCRTQKGNMAEYRKYIQKCISRDDSEMKAALGLAVMRWGIKRL